jgi:ubiquinone/menaquinone biosynthesis C-methylase UbiE
VYVQRERIVRELRLLSGATVADVGAGTGAFTTLLAEAVGPRGTVYAVDIVPEFLLHIRKRVAQAGLTNVQTVLCGERSVSLPPNSTDVVFLCDAYHHLEYPLQTLASLRDALRLGGELVVIDFRRIEGESSDWVMEHVRAGQEEVMREIQAAGFRQVEELDFLEKNYFLRFRKKGT